MKKAIAAFAIIAVTLALGTTQTGCAGNSQFGAGIGTNGLGYRFVHQPTNGGPMITNSAHLALPINPAALIQEYFATGGF